MPNSNWDTTDISQILNKRMREMAEGGYGIGPVAHRIAMHPKQFVRILDGDMTTLRSLHKVARALDMKLVISVDGHEIT